MIIYCIKNTINDKEYIGLTTRDLSARWKQHIRESNRENSWEWNTPLGNAIKKYGTDCFSISILKECVSEDELKNEEIRLIEERNSHVSKGGYNLTFGGDGRLGYIMSQETKDKIGAGNKGKKYTAEVRQKISEIKSKQYQLSGHPKAMTIVVNKTEKFNCLKEFTNKYNLKYSTVVESLRKNNGKTVFKSFEIERINNG